MKKLVLIIMLFFVCSNISAIRINELESNPSGQDAGNEWVELYSDEEVELEGYKIVNNDGDELVLSGSFSGYYVYVFEKQWLDNSDEKVFLYKNGELIDETNLFDDDKDNEMGWQFCESWEFAESTKGEKNLCEEEIEEPEPEIFDKTNEKNNTDEKNTSQPFSEESKEVKKPEEPKGLEVIKLNPKDIKSNENEEVQEDTLSKNRYAIYAFVVFCVLLGVLFISKKFRKNKYKNEFE